MRLADALALRINGKDAIEARFNGSVVWPVVVPPIGPQITVTTGAMRYPEDDPYSATPNAPYPEPIEAGDELLFAVAVTARGPINWTGSGFDQIEAIGQPGGDYMYVGRRLATGHESGSIQVLLDGGAGDWFAMAIRIRGGGAYRAIDPKFVAVGPRSIGTPVPIAGPEDVTVPAGRLALWLGSISTFGASSGTVSALSLPSGFDEEGRIVDNVCEALVCGSRVLEDEETGTLSGSVTFTGSDYFKSFAAVIQYGEAVPVAMGLVGTLPATATVGVPYSGELTATGDYTEPVTPGIESGTLPDWLDADYADGKITYSGTPDEDGVVTFTPKATDNDSQVAIGDEQTITVSAGGGSVGVVQNTGIRKFLPVTGKATITPAAPFAAGNTVIVSLGVYNPASVNLSTACNVQINGVSATCAVAGNNDGWGHAIFYGVAGSGSAGIEITFSSSPSGGSENYIVAGAIECDDLGDLDQTATNAGTGNVCTITTPSTTEANERIVAAVTTANNLIISVTIDGSDTLIYQDTDGANEVPNTCAYRDVESAGAQTVTWGNGGNSSNSWRMVAATFKKQ